MIDRQRISHLPEGGPEEINEDAALIRLDRALHSPIFYPGDYGFAPRTLAAGRVRR